VAKYRPASRSSVFRTLRDYRLDTLNVRGVSRRRYGGKSRYVEGALATREAVRVRAVRAKHCSVTLDCSVCCRLDRQGSIQFYSRVVDVIGSRKRQVPASRALAFYLCSRRRATSRGMHRLPPCAVYPMSNGQLQSVVSWALMRTLHGFP